MTDVDSEHICFEHQIHVWQFNNKVIAEMHDAVLWNVAENPKRQ